MRRRLGPGRESLGEEAEGRDTERTGTEEDGGGGGGGVCDGGAAAPPSSPPRHTSAFAAAALCRCGCVS